MLYIACNYCMDMTCFLNQLKSKLSAAAVVPSAYAPPYGTGTIDPRYVWRETPFLSFLFSPAC